MTRVLGLLIVVVAATPICGADPSPAELLSAYEETLTPFRRVAFRARYKQVHQGPTMPPGTVLDDSDVRVRRDGDRLWLFASSTANAIIDGERKAERRLGEMVLSGEGSQHAVLDPDSRRVTHVMACDKELSGVEKGQICAGAPYSLPVWGLLTGNGSLPLPEILRKQSSLTMRDEVLGGVSARVLDAEGKWGHHTLWLDPARRNLPLRIVQKKIVGVDWVSEGVPIPPFIGEGSWYPKAPKVEGIQRMDATKIEHVGGRDVVTEFSLTYEVYFKGGPTTVLFTHVLLSDIDFNPEMSEKAFRISTPIPNGTPVYLKGSEMIRREMRDGKIVEHMGIPPVQR
jgi:hypothetical protein